MPDPTTVSAIFSLLYTVVLVGTALRVLASRRPVGVTLAWLLTLVLLPFVGLVLYLLIGEVRLGRQRLQRIEDLREPYQRMLRASRERHSIDWSRLHSQAEPIHRLGDAALGWPAYPGNRMTLFTEAHEVQRAIVDDIEQATQSVHMVFYIWHDGGTVDEVSEALVAAARRGVLCRILVDALGGQDFFSGAACRRLRREGVQVVESLSVSFWRIPFQRLDLRNHRKIVVIDGHIGYSGSMNMVDPRYYKRERDLGEWIDVMARITGPAVEALNLSFLLDWELETDIGIAEVERSGGLQDLEPDGDCIVQVVPSSPGMAPTAIREMVVKTIHAARRELVLTTPYFVPDETMVTALTSAAHSGVEVTLIVPERLDSTLTRWAGEAYFQELLEAGVEILRFRRGLLHSKILTVDGEVGVMGTLNMDMRSFHINFEVTLFLYDGELTRYLVEVQDGYRDDATAVDLEEWRRRSWTRHAAEHVGRLFGPLL